MNRLLFLGIIGAVTSDVSVAGAAQSRAVVRVAAIPAELAAECWYAEDLGYFREAGLDVQLTTLSNAGAILDAVASRSVDIGFANIIMAAQAYQRGLSIEVVAPANLYVAAAPTTGYLAVAGDSKINNAADLSGKAVAVNGTGGIVHFATRAWIDAHGGNSANVRFIEFPLSQMPALLLNGRVDAAVLDAAGYGSVIHAERPARLLGNTFNAVSPNFIVAGWVSNKDFAQANPGVIRAFRAVMTRTAGWANSHRRESAEILARHTRMSITQINETARVTYGTLLNPALLRPNLDLAQRYGALQGPLAPGSILGSGTLSR
jgi:NitT/TauT family transport system substrate-binding protein